MPPAPTLGMTITGGGQSSSNSIIVPSGTEVIIDWSSQNAVSCDPNFESGGFISKLQGQYKKTAISDEDFLIVCKNSSDNTVAKSVSVDISTPECTPGVNCPPPEPPTVFSPTLLSFKITSGINPINYGDSVTLGWETENASYCEASGDWEGNKDPNYFEVRENITSPKTFRLTCYRDLLSSDTKTVNVSINASSYPQDINPPNNQNNQGDNTPTDSSVPPPLGNQGSCTDNQEGNEQNPACGEGYDGYRKLVCVNNYWIYANSFESECILQSTPLSCSTKTPTTKNIILGATL
ncbi:MAG: hypothetical protein COV57_00840, partial [Candidatus Liptonbacteria bacterium CG11_big_fil_rev_8_21_14_0_20_35_14]